MSTANRPELERAAGAVADAESVDWDDLEREHPELSDTLERLRAIERLANAHRDARAEHRGEASAPPEAGAETRWGPLVLVERLGTGSFGEVWRAQDTALRRDVALKLRRGDAGSTRAWLDEARRLARLSHPNVVQVFGVDQHRGRAGFWTELVRGETLEARLARDGPLPERDVALIGIDLCRALSAVHAAGLVHGDLKAANVMREGGEGATRPGRIVLMDFGAGLDAPAASPSTWTPLVTAPEVLRGGQASEASDQYALGVLLYRLLTRAWPRQADSIPNLLAHAGEVPPLRALRPDLSGDMHDSVLRALAAEPGARHASLSAFESSLARTLDGAPAGVGAPARSRNVWGWTALAAVAVLVAALLLARPWTPVAIEQRPTVATPAPAPTPPLAVSATLVRRSARGTEPLLDGATVHTGDRLALDLRVEEPVWAYVLDEDATGAVFALFPLQGLDTGNPLAPGVDHRLPGLRQGRPFAWEVTPGSGAETFLVIVSRHALPEVEAEIASLTPARAGPPASRERGVEGLVPDASTPLPSGRNQLDGLVERLAAAGDVGVWVRRLRVVHGGS